VCFDFADFGANHNTATLQLNIFLSCIHLCQAIIPKYFVKTRKFWFTKEEQNMQKFHSFQFYIRKASAE
jgi:hypothetical protein